MAKGTATPDLLRRTLDAVYVLTRWLDDHRPYPTFEELELVVDIRRMLPRLMQAYSDADGERILEIRHHINVLVVKLVEIRGLKGKLRRDSHGNQKRKA